VYGLGESRCTRSQDALRAFPMLDKATPLLDTQVIALDMMG